MPDKGKIRSILLFSLSLLLTFVLGGGTIFAQGTAPPDFTDWAKFMYPFLLSVAAISAVLMLVIAGIEMMTVSPGLREDAKKRIWAAILGLLLAVLSYLILWTINPQLTTITLNVENLKVKVEGPPPVDTGGETGFIGHCLTGLVEACTEFTDEQTCIDTCAFNSKTCETGGC